VRIVLVSNSQGTPAGVDAGQHYPALVRNQLVPEDEVHLLVVSGWSVGSVTLNVSNIVDVEPDVVVLQLGIVEAARRILSTREKDLLRRFGRLSRPLTRLLHTRRQQVIRLRNTLGLDTRLYSPEQFDREIRELLSALTARGIDAVLLEIPPFSPEFEREHYPLIGDDVETFNSILRRNGAVPLLPPGTDTHSIWQPGTVHFTREGHRIAAERIVELVRERSPRGAGVPAH
jgi:lysophospholipase L1-like esterase